MKLHKTIQRLAKSMRPKDRDFSESETVVKCMLRYQRAEKFMIQKSTKYTFIWLRICNKNSVIENSCHTENVYQSWKHYETLLHKNAILLDNQTT